MVFPTPTNRVNWAFLNSHILDFYHNSRNRKIIDDFVMIREYEQHNHSRPNAAAEKFLHNAKKPRQPWRNIIHSHQGFSKISQPRVRASASKPF